MARSGFPQESVGGGAAPVVLFARLRQHLDWNSGGRDAARASGSLPREQARCPSSSSERAPNASKPRAHREWHPRCLRVSLWPQRQEETKSRASRRKGAPMASPTKFAHVVFNTHRYEKMIHWYLRVFEARVQYRNDCLAFLTYDDEHHRFAFVNLGPAPDGLPARREDAVGVHHLAYTWNGVGELADVYTRLKADGILPLRPIRHGPTLSLYYKDPDGNQLEFQVDLLTPDKANEFMRGPAFAENPIGEPFDPDELVDRLEAGRPVDEMVFRSDQLQASPARPRAALA